MASDSTAIVIASLSGAVSLAAAFGVEWSRHRTTRQLQLLREEQDVELETLRSMQAKALEEFKDGLARARDRDDKDEKARRLVDTYRDPLLRSALDLQSRIYNVYRPGGFRGGRDPEYFRLNTLFLLADLLGWLEIIRRELQFLDLGAVDATKQLGLNLSRLQDLLATTSSWRDNCYIYRGSSVRSAN